MTKWKFDICKAELYQFEPNTVEFTNGVERFAVTFATDVFYIDSWIEEKLIPQFYEKEYAARLGHIHLLQECLFTNKGLYPNEPSRVPDKVIKDLTPVPDGKPNDEYIANYVRACKVLNPPKKIKDIQRKIMVSDRIKLITELSNRFGGGGPSEAEKEKAIQWRYEGCKGFSDIKETRRTARKQWKKILNSK